MLYSGVCTPTVKYTTPIDRNDTRRIEKALLFSANLQVTRHGTCQAHWFTVFCGIRRVGSINGTIINANPNPLSS